MWKVTNADKSSAGKDFRPVRRSLVNWPTFTFFISCHVIIFWHDIIGTVPSMFIYLLTTLPDLSFCFLLPGAESAPIKNRQQFHWMSHNESFTSSGSMLIGSDHPGLISSSIFVNFESFYTDREYEKRIRETENLGNFLKGQGHLGLFLRRLMKC